MGTFRIALANLQFPATPEESIALAEQGIAQASSERADLICFPECFIPGYQPYGKRGLLIADIDLTEATGLLAARCKSG
jgi:predicted amidohydrolase